MAGATLNCTIVEVSLARPAATVRRSAEPSALSSRNWEAPTATTTQLASMRPSSRRPAWRRPRDVIVVAAIAALS